MQQDRIQAEVLKNKKEQEAAILGLQQLKKQQLERKYFLFYMILRSYHFRFGGLKFKPKVMSFWYNFSFPVKFFPYVRALWILFFRTELLSK